MTAPSSNLSNEIEEHIHMLGCQAMTEARNLGYAEGKGEKPDNKDLLDMIEEHEAALTTLFNKQITAELQNVLTMNGWHEGDWKQAITERIKELERGAE